MTRLLLLTSLSALSLAAASATPPSPIAERLYKAKCAACHGGEGEGGIGVSFKGKLAHPTAKELHEVIKNGIAGTSMPASGLPDPSVDKLVVYVQYLHKKK